MSERLILRLGPSEGQPLRHLPGHHRNSIAIALLTSHVCGFA